MCDHAEPARSAGLSGDDRMRGRRRGSPPPRVQVARCDDPVGTAGRTLGRTSHGDRRPVRQRDSVLLDEAMRLPASRACVARARLGSSARPWLGGSARASCGGAVPRIVWVYPLTILGIAFAAIFVRLAVPAPPTVTGFYRMFFAAIAMAAWAAATGRKVVWRGRAAAFALASGASFGLDLAFWHTSIVETSVGLATLLVNLTPIHLGLFAVTVRRERLAPRFVAGAALALAGMVLLLGVPGLHANGPGSGLRGPGFAIVASLFYAGYLLLMSEARREMDAFDALLLMT